MCPEKVHARVRLLSGSTVGCITPELAALHPCCLTNVFKSVSFPLDTVIHVPGSLQSAGRC